MHQSHLLALHAVRLDLLSSHDFQGHAPTVLDPRLLSSSLPSNWVNRVPLTSLGLFNRGHQCGMCSTAALGGRVATTFGHATCHAQHPSSSWLTDPPRPLNLLIVASRPAPFLPPDSLNPSPPAFESFDNPRFVTNTEAPDGPCWGPFKLITLTSSTCPLQLFTHTFLTFFS